MKYYVYIDRMTFICLPAIKGRYWKSFDSKLSALVFAKVNGYKLIAKGKTNA